MNVIRFLLLIFIAIIVFTLILMIKKKRRISAVLLSFLGCIIIVIGIFNFINGREKYIKIVNKDDEVVEIRLDNKKDYYGHDFYRFSTDLSEDELLNYLQKDYSNAYYNEEQKKIVFEYNGEYYRIVYEGESNILWYKNYKYLFAENDE